MQGSSSAVEKKKKKYVMVRSPQQEEPAVRTRRSSPTSVLSHSRFDYSFEQMLNHVFAKLLPDSRFIIRFSEKLIFGKDEELDKLLQELDQNTRYYSCFLLQLEDDNQRQDIEYEIEERHRAKLFGKKLIQKCIVELFQGTCYELQCTAFLKMFQTDRHQRLFVRMSRQYVEQFLERISGKARLVKQTSISDRVSNRGNRRELRTQFQKITLDGEAFDVKNWKDFLQRSQKLDKKDIQIIQTKNAYGYTETYTVRLLCMQGEEVRKIQAFNYYFRHQNFIGLPLKASQRKKAFLQKYGSFKKNWLQIRMIRGYKNEKWDEKTVLYKLRCGQVPPRRTNFASEPIELVLLVGLLPKVREYLQILQKQLNNVPMDDVKVELYLQLEDELSDALKSSNKVEIFLQKFIKQYVFRFKDSVESVAVKFLLRGIRLDLKVHAAREEQFKKGVAIQLESTMLKEISVRKFDLDFPVDEQLRMRLQKEGLLITSVKEKTIHFVTSIDALAAALTTIQSIQLDYQSLDQETIQCRGRIRLAHYQQIIKSVKENAQYGQVFITDADSVDKVNFTISFIGPKKKTNMLAKQVRNRIAELQNSFGCYSQALQQDVCRFLLQDTVIQEQLLNKYKISIMVDSGVKIDASLDIEPLAINKKINIIKANNLSRVPFGSSIYFAGKEQLDCFNQAFLENIKAKAKRAKQSQYIKDEENSRQLTLFYKDTANHMELLSTAFDQRKEESFCLILPTTEKEKYVHNVLTTLTSIKSYQQKKYSITLIDPDAADDVKAIVALPQSSSVYAKEHVIVEWFCEGVPYAQSGNDKINDAVANGSSKCLLSLQDLNQTNRMSTPKTHTCNLRSKTIRNVKTGQEVPLIQQNGMYQFTYKNYSFQLSPQQLNLMKYYRRSDMSWFYLPLMYYEIDLAAMTQTNIFTGKQRKLKKSERIIVMDSSEQYQGKVHAAYDVPSPQLVFNFLKEDSRNLGVAVLQASNYVQAKRKRQIIALKDIRNEFRGKLKELITARANENELVCSYDIQRNEVIAQSLEQRKVERFRQLIQKEVDYMLSIEQMTSKPTVKQMINYPSFWEQQVTDVQYFVVSPNTQQFKQVQALFTIRPITSLWRIQNKYLYQKYVDELQHLTFLNGGKKPKELQLFHGTKYTDPQLIWADRQGGFNINYSNEANLLGMGVYFAQKSQYSLDYSHKSVNGRSMFLCSVIVGDSQLMKMSRTNAHVRDTEVKGMNGLKYESMLGKHDICDIYVVYKDKRAYPNYLIHFN